MSIVSEELIESAATFEPRERTEAPLRYVMTIPVKADRAAAIDALFEFDRMTRYLPSIKKVDVECRADGTPETRYCTVSGMGRLREDIVWFDEQLGYAYSADAPGLPMKEHLAVATVSDSSTGGSEIRFEVYFNWRGVLKPIMMRAMFPGMMKALGKGLQADLIADGSVNGNWT